VVSYQYLVNRSEAEVQVVQADQLVPQAPNSELTVTTERENELLFAASHLLARRSMRPPTVAEEAGDVGCSMPPHPLA
jgi:hypothetical protein